MSYLALYRKWRPSTFDDIKGQDTVVETLRNQIVANRIGHAYLFCGTRGTGKTSAAKVFAKAINCENPNNGNPCGECASCKAIAAGNSMNVIEMDAATNNGVNDVRQIIDDVEYSPTDAKYKVYIIDEVHMMSDEAFNALLKTLEEPPSYVVFILATTEPQDLLVTILSRCQRYDFRRIPKTIIEDRIKEVAAAENIVIEDKAVSYIAKNAEGGMRDALSLLDQCTSFFMGKEITYERALDILGAVDTSVFSELLRGIVARSVVDALNVVDRALVQGRNLSHFVVDFTWHLRNVLLIKASDDAEEVVDATEENLALLKKEAEGIPEEQIMRYIRIFSELTNNLRHASQKRVLVELAIIKICRPQMETSYDSLVDRIRSIEEKIENGTLSVSGVSESKVAGENNKQNARKETEEAKKLPKATQEELGKVASLWKNIVKALPEMYTACLRTAVPSVRPSDGRLIIQLMDATVKFLCDDDACRKCLDEAFAKVMGTEVEYEMVAATEVGNKGEYYPPASIFGMDIVIDDSEFDE